MSTPTQLVSTEKAPASSVGVFAWMRSQLFSSPINSLLTILSVWLLLATVPAMVDWFFINANATASTADECRKSTGACWAMIVEKHRIILFGLYPYDEQWRPLIATGILVGSIIVSGWSKLWNMWLLVVWTASLTTVAILMWGGMFGLTYVENTQWGGLPLTLILSTFGIALAFPLGIVLALGRRSNMPAIKSICIVYIELIRGVPLISLLFMSAVMLPLFLPEGMSIDKLLRALPISSLLIDQNGIGMQLAEKASQHPAAQGFTFTNSSKGLLAVETKLRAQRAEVPIPLDRDFSYQIHSVRKKVTGANNTIFDVDAAERHHADMYWAWALAIWAGQSDGSQTVGESPLSGYRG
jgi:His/Glu/Gln/Arg/opine family amino acid ABC transporter permease subunit